MGDEGNGGERVKRLLVTGSRTWNDEAGMDAALSEAWLELGSDAVLVHGAAAGADTMAERLWLGRGGTVEAHPVNYSDPTVRPRYAPLLRNTKMVHLGADLCLAFLGKESRGTYDCIGKARAAGIPVRVVNQSPRTPGWIVGETVKIEAAE